MNLETHIDAALWNAIRGSYEAKNFKSAILDAIHLLGDVIRERTGLDGDGVQLIGEAFGGQSPQLKITKLQTESERNMQRGIESILRGIFQAVRNPRSHGQHTDTQTDADSIIIFLDYLLRIVGTATAPFSLESLVKRIHDPHFVPTQRYAELLVDEIPERKRLAACLEIFSNRSDTNRTKLQNLFAILLKSLSQEERKEFTAVVSNELSTTNDEVTIRFVLSALPSAIWPEYSEVARLRVENMLIDSVKQGKWSQCANKCTGGAMGTYLRRVLQVLTLKSEFWHAVMDKLASTDPLDQDYALGFFLEDIIPAYTNPPSRLTKMVHKGLAEGDIRFKYLADKWAEGWIDDKPDDDPWVQPFKKGRADFQEKQNDSVSEDDIPF